MQVVKKKKVDVNPEDNFDFSKVVSSISGNKIKGTDKKVVSEIISKVIENPKKIAIFAGYFLLSGIVINGIWIYKGIKLIINLF